MSSCNTSRTREERRRCRRVPRSHLRTDRLARRRDRLHPFRQDRRNPPKHRIHRCPRSQLNRPMHQLQPRRPIHWYLPNRRRGPCHPIQPNLRRLPVLPLRPNHQVEPCLLLRRSRPPRQVTTRRVPRRIRSSPPNHRRPKHPPLLRDRSRRRSQRYHRFPRRHPRRPSIPHRPLHQRLRIPRSSSHPPHCRRSARRPRREIRPPSDPVHRCRRRRRPVVRDLGKRCRRKRAARQELRSKPRSESSNFALDPRKAILEPVTVSPPAEPVPSIRRAKGRFRADAGDGPEHGTLRRNDATTPEIRGGTFHDPPR